MKVTRKVFMLSSLFIVLVLLFGTSCRRGTRTEPQRRKYRPPDHSPGILSDRLVLDYLG